MERNKGYIRRYSSAAGFDFLDCVKFRQFKISLYFIGFLCITDCIDIGGYAFKLFPKLTIGGGSNGNFSSWCY